MQKIVDFPFHLGLYSLHTAQLSCHISDILHRIISIICSLLHRTQKYAQLLLTFGQHLLFLFHFSLQVKHNVTLLLQ